MTIPAFLEWDLPLLPCVGDAWEFLLVWQAGRCAMCGTKAQLVRDHDHETGMTRGGLCHGCNLHEGFCKAEQCRCAKYRRCPPAVFLGLQIRYPGHPFKGVEFLTREEARALLVAPSKRAPTGLRNRALIAVMYGAGLKVSEALAVHESQVDYAMGAIVVGDRTTRIEAECLSFLPPWANRRNELGLDNSPRFFCTLDGGAVSPRYVQAMLRRYARRAKIDKRVSPNVLRHAHVAELQASRWTIRAIQEQTGHASLAITEAYIRRVAGGLCGNESTDDDATG